MKCGKRINIRCAGIKVTAKFAKNVLAGNVKKIVDMQ